MDIDRNDKQGRDFWTTAPEQGQLTSVMCLPFLWLLSNLAGHRSPNRESDGKEADLGSTHCSLSFLSLVRHQKSTHRATTLFFFLSWVLEQKRMWENCARLRHIDPGGSWFNTRNCNYCFGDKIWLCQSCCPWTCDLPASDFWIGTHLFHHCHSQMALDTELIYREPVILMHTGA